MLVDYDEIEQYEFHFDDGSIFNSFTSIFSIYLFRLASSEVTTFVKPFSYLDDFISLKSPKIFYLPVLLFLGRIYLQNLYFK